MENDSGKLWLKRIFVLTCILVIGVSLGVLISRFGLAAPLPAIVASTGAVLIAYIGWKHFALSRDVGNLKIHASHTAKYLEELERKLDLVSQSHAGSAVNQVPAETSLADEIVPEPAASISNEPEEIETTPVPAELKSEPVKTLQPLDKADVRSALKNGELGMHLQPIVELPDRKPAYFEAFMRINNKSQGYLDNREFRKVAATSGLLPSLEQKVIFASSRILTQLITLEKPAGIYCSLSPHTLRDADTWEKIYKFVAKNSELAPSITFQISQRDYLALNKKERGQLASLKKFHANLALCNVLDPSIDLAELHKAGIDAVKCPGSILVHGDHGTKSLNAFLSSFAENGIKLIADEIEQEQEASTLMDAGLIFAQGKLFAPPRPVKSELL